MIHYQLQCGEGHGFDGWFRDSAAFEAQVARRLVECPICADTTVTRALMAPAVTKGVPAPSVAPPPPAQPKQVAVTGERMPDHVRAMLQRLRAEIERRCDYVGDRFAEEARRIHKGESAPRGIYGEASAAEAEALADEGIEVARIPWVPRAEG
jgi:hypothetical protein